MKYLLLGIVGDAHGLSGHFFILYRDSLFPKTYDSIVIGEDPEAGISCQVLDQKMSRGLLVIQVANIDLNDVKGLGGKKVWVSRDKVEIDSETEYLWDDLIGAEVVNREKNLIGHVLALDNAGASDVVKIGRKDGKFLNIPLVADYFKLGDLKHSTKKLQLTCDENIFTEFWQDEKK